MARAVYTKTLLEKKSPKFTFDGVLKDVLGNPGTNGIWIIYGAEKHGKTWFSVKLAEYLSRHKRTLYISGEEGIEDTFIETCNRARLDPSNRKLKFLDYTPLEELDEYLSKRQSPGIVFIDNLTIYSDELKNGVLRKFVAKHHTKLFVLIAHEENNDPYTATAKMARRLAKIIVRIVGLTAFVSGRCPGGQLNIDMQRARLYHGENNLKQ